MSDSEDALGCESSTSESTPIQRGGHVDELCRVGAPEPYKVVCGAVQYEGGMLNHQV